jgi:uncharacterized protein (TIGR02145 family)
MKGVVMKRKVIPFIMLSILMFPVTVWAGLSQTQVSQLYVAIFNRASEGEGNRYWQTLELDMATTADVMLQTDAAKNYFGASLDDNQAFIEHIYLNTLNKTLADDYNGIAWWVGMLDRGATRGTVVATLVSVIKDYAPDGPHASTDPATMAAYRQFTNRLEVSDYLADTIEKPPVDWARTTRFDSSGLNVTDNDLTVIMAKNMIDVMANTQGVCGAYIAPGVWKAFDCYNLAAIGKTTGDDPFIPSWRLIGGHWQWGRRGLLSEQWYGSNSAHYAHGPTGPGPGNANAGSIDAWEQNDALDKAWDDDVKTIHDPCPAGFRVPTRRQWAGVITNNARNSTGTWSSGLTQYSSAWFFGANLMLPAAGSRDYRNGALINSGSNGGYWSSTGDAQFGNPIAWHLYFTSSRVSAGNYHYRTNGFSVRCIEK